VGSNAGFSDMDMMRALGPARSQSDLVYTKRMTGNPQGNELGYGWRRVFLETSGRDILARVAAITTEYFHRHNDRPALLSIPVDVRPRVPGLESTSNFCNALQIRMNKGEGADVFRQRLRAKMDARGDLYCPRVLDLFKMFSLPVLDLLVSGIAGDYRGRGTVETVMISNLGRLDSRDFSSDHFRMKRLFAVPPFNSQVYSMLVGVDDQVEFVVGMPRVLASDGRFDEFTAFLLQRLAETEIADSGNGSKQPRGEPPHDITEGAI
jgi:hypothetical protein